MLRGILGPMEKHHTGRIHDAALVAAVNLSQRYIPARQVRDKAVSLLDTASARVAISQSAVPALIEDTKAAIDARQNEKAALMSDSDLGAEAHERIGDIEREIATLKETLAELESEWATENKLVNEIRSLRDILNPPKQGDGAAKPPAGAQPAATPSPVAQPASEPVDKENVRNRLRETLQTLEGRDPEKRMIYPHVDEHVVASVVSDWTGIPIGRMVKDEIDNVLKLPEILNRRVVGQSHGLSVIAKRIETNRAKLDNPNKPIGVFTLCGPPGAAKPRTPLT